MTRSTASKSYRGVPSAVLAIHPEDVVEDGVRPDRLDAELGRGRCGTRARGPRRRRSPPGPSPRSSMARCSEPIDRPPRPLDRRRSSAPASTATVTSPSSSRPRHRACRRRHRADGRIDAGQAGDRVDVVALDAGRRVDVRPVRDRKDVTALVVDGLQVAVGPARGGRGTRPRPSTGDHDTVTWPRPRSARTSAGAGRTTSGAGRSRSVDAPKLSNQAMPGRAGRARRAARGPVSVVTGGRSSPPARAGVERLHADDRPEDLAELLGRERLAQHVVRQGIADRGHDDALVERQVVAGRDARLDVDRVAETPLVVHVEVGLQVGEVVHHARRAPSAGRGTPRAASPRRSCTPTAADRASARAARAILRSRGRQGLLLVRLVAVRIHPDGVDAVLGVAAFGDVRGREAPVAVFRLDEAVMDLRGDRQRVVDRPAARAPTSPRGRTTPASAPRTCSRPSPGRRGSPRTGRRPRRRRRRDTSCGSRPAWSRASSSRTCPGTSARRRSTPSPGSRPWRSRCSSRCGSRSRSCRSSTVSCTGARRVSGRRSG